MIRSAIVGMCALADYHLVHETGAVRKTNWADGVDSYTKPMT